MRKLLNSPPFSLESDRDPPNFVRFVNESSHRISLPIPFSYLEDASRGSFMALPEGMMHLHPLSLTLTTWASCKSARLIERSV